MSHLYERAIMTSILQLKLSEKSQVSPQVSCQIAIRFQVNLIPKSLPFPLLHFLVTL